MQMEKENPMADLERNGPPRQPSKQLQILRRKHEESNTMLAILMAGIAALCLVGIVAAYNYASNTNIVETPSPAATANAPAKTVPGARMPGETTGSGSTERPQQAVPDKSQKQQ
jgi:hypothetical protein